MKLLSDKDRLEAVAHMRSIGHPDPEGAIADAEAALSGAIKDGKLPLQWVDGELGAKVSDVKRLFP